MRACSVGGPKQDCKYGYLHIASMGRCLSGQMENSRITGYVET